jgi:hypothetical protein
MMIASRDAFAAGDTLMCRYADERADAPPLASGG